MVKIIKKTFDALMTVILILLVVMWTLQISLLLWQGRTHESFNEIITFTMAVLCFISTRRMERLSAICKDLAMKVKERDVYIHLYEMAIDEYAKNNNMEKKAAEIMDDYLKNKATK